MFDRVKNEKQYLENKRILKQRYEAERAGDIQAYQDQSKILGPLIKSQQETSKATQDKIVASQDLTSNALTQSLIPFTDELRRINDQVDTLQQFPYYQAQIDQPQPLPIAESTPEKKIDIYDLDQDLNITDRENLNFMEFDLPSIVFVSNMQETTIKKIKKERRSIGQYLGEGPKRLIVNKGNF